MTNLKGLKTPYVERFLMDLHPCLSGTKQEEQYEKFQQWLDACPVKISDRQNFTDEIQINFTLD
mgnify:CR=1 FL=1|tara:strand:- start:1754 stop:1945 length:192 start_codon:yes stop_codon:yes gene_type:complete